MTFRNRLLVSAAILGLAGLVANSAQAGLLNAGSTVLTDYYPGTNDPAATENENTVSFGSPSPVSLASPVNYIQGADDGSAIVVGDTTIAITNLLPFTFCSDGTSAGAACTDAIDGFEFKFAGEDILGATIDPASAAAFLPATFSGHSGLDLVNADDLLIDLTGAGPAVNDQLIIDLSFVSTSPPPPTTTPEPASLMLLGVAIGGIFATRRPRMKQA